MVTLLSGDERLWPIRPRGAGDRSALRVEHDDVPGTEVVGVRVDSGPSVTQETVPDGGCGSRLRRQDQP
jgi:hypothetical protein